VEDNAIPTGKMEFDITDDMRYIHDFLGSFIIEAPFLGEGWGGGAGDGQARWKTVR
jgi:hypothetical protein